MKNGIQNGLLAAAGFCAIYMITYFVAPRMNFWMSYDWLYTTIISLLFMIRAARQEKNETTGSFTFGEALIPAMITFAVATFVFTSFTLVLFHIDPNQVDLAQEAGIELMESMSQMSGVDEDDFLVQMEEAVEGMKDQTLNIGTNFINWIVALIIPGLIYGAIAAAISRKKEPTV